MFLTELVYPNLKQDAATHAALPSAMSTLSNAVKQAPGHIRNVYGHIIEENGLSLDQAGLRIIVSLEWESIDSFNDFVATDSYKALGLTLQALVAGPYSPEIFATNNSPIAVQTAPLTEIFRFEVAEDERLNAARKSWDSFTAAITASDATVGTLDGISVNMETKAFLGMIGWKSAEDRNRVGRLDDVFTAKKHVLDLELVTSFLVKLE